MELNPTTLVRLRAFVAVGHRISFKLAARDLHLTQSALSHHVRNLEEQLGVALVIRMHRRIELTAEGRQLLEECAVGFERLARAVRRVRSVAQGKALTVSVAPYFSARWLTPRLGSLWSRHPELELHLRHAYQPADFLHDDVDAGICWGHGRWPDAHATALLPGDLTAVCSPDLLRRLPAELAPVHLRGTRLFCEFDEDHWHGWFRAAGVQDIGELNAVRIDDSHALRRAALDGHGFALFFRALVHEELRAGQLVQPFDVVVNPGCAYYLVRPRSRPVGPKLAAFTSWLLEEVMRDPIA